MNITIVTGNRIPSLRYGGLQRVVWCLGKELSRKGHNVTFLAPKDSYCPFAKIVELNATQSIESQIPPETDITHFHISVPEEFEKPHIETIHGNHLPRYVDKNVVFVSKNHAERFGCDSYVYNGLDWDEYEPVNLNLPRQHFHFLGKAAWKVKNLKGAISVTKCIPHGELDVLGGYRLNFKMGFRFTWSPRIHFHGMVNDLKKKEIIQKSKGLIFPVTWHEPFGLAIIESLYMGSPVFGTPYGALPELITPEVGFLSDNAEEIARHISTHTYSPQICHEYARDLFNASVMADSYLKKYETVLNGETLCPTPPVYKDISRNLPWS